MQEEKNGEFVGAFPPYGYKRSKKDIHKLEIDEQAAMIVKKIFEWKAYEGIGNLKICHRLNEMGILNPTGYKRKILKSNYKNATAKDYFWTPSTIRNILRNDIYIGNITQGKRRVKSYKIHKLENVDKKEWITVENMQKPIIEKKLFEKVQKIQSKDTKVQENGYLSLWAGNLRCSTCQKAMNKKVSTNKNGNRYEYYICSTYRQKSNKLCTNHTIKVENLEKIVLELLKYQISFCNLKKVIEKYETQNKENILIDNQDNIIKEKDKKIKRLNELKMNLYEDFKNGILTKIEYFEYKERYNCDIEKIKRNISFLRERKINEDILETSANKWIEDIKRNKNINKLDREILEEFIDYIEIYDNKNIKVYLKCANEEKETDDNFI